MPTRIGAEPKSAWRAVPRAVRSQVEGLVGARVARALRVWGGYAPSPTFRLFLAGLSKRSGSGQLRRPGRAAQAAEAAAAGDSARAGRECHLPAVDAQPQCAYSGGGRPPG
jgi:hypothetical protein